MSAEAWRMVVRTPGGPEQIERETIPIPQPAAGEVRIRVAAAGLNFIDTYHRTGLYPLPYPSGLGGEAAGIIDAVGDGVTGWQTGERVAFLSAAPGCYATHVVTEADRLVRLPDGISEEVAAAVLLKGFTCWMLAEPCGKVEPGMTVLVHAAAGGVGSMLVPWLKHRGATVIAHAGSAEKAEIARKNGADHVSSVSFDQLPKEVREITGGHGADVVFDGVGSASWNASLASVARRGLVISYGNASGAVPPVAPLDLLRAGSVFLTRPQIGHYVDGPEARAIAADRLFELIKKGVLPVHINQRFPLARAADAHRALEARQTTGLTILVP